MLHQGRVALATMYTRKDDGGDPHWFSENVKKWRKERRLSQEDLARKITELSPEVPTFHQQTIQKIENRTRRVSLTDACFITAALELDLNTMLANPNDRSESVAEQQKKLLRRNLRVVQLATKELEKSLDNLGFLIDDIPVEERQSDHGVDN